jgi:tetratricopeptide (TPR) repeat protein
MPLEALFVRLLSVAAGGILALVERPRLITALVPDGNRIVLYSGLTGTPARLTFVNFDSVHISVVAAIALALAVPMRGWRARVRTLGLALALVFVVMVAVAVVQIEAAAETHARAELGLEIHTARESARLEWLIRKSSLVAVFVLPAALFLTTYVASAPRAGRAAGVERAASAARLEGVGEPRPEHQRRPSRLAPSVLGACLAGFAVCGVLALRPSEAPGVLSPESLGKIADLNPSSALARFQVGRDLETRGRFAAARDAYERATGIDPGLVEAYVGAGNAASKLGDYDRAAASFAEALRRDPGNRVARHGLAGAHLLRGQYDEAVATYEAILAADPRDASAERDLGITLVRLHRRCDALPHLERSLALDPSLARDEEFETHVASLRKACAG